MMIKSFYYMEKIDNNNISELSELLLLEMGDIRLSHHHKNYCEANKYYIRNNQAPGSLSSLLGYMLLNGREYCKTCIKELIRLGAELCENDKRRIIEMSKESNNKLGWIIDKKIININICIDNLTLLHYPFMQRNISYIKYLIKKGINVNILDGDFRKSHEKLPYNFLTRHLHYLMVTNENDLIMKLFGLLIDTGLNLDPIDINILLKNDFLTKKRRKQQNKYKPYLDQFVIPVLVDIVLDYT